MELTQVNLSISKQMKLTIIGDIDVKQTMNQAAKNNQLEQQGTARHGANQLTGIAVKKLYFVVNGWQN